MKRSIQIIGILSIGFLLNALAIPTVQAQCTGLPPYPIYSYYSVIDQIPGTAVVDAMFYAYESDATGLFAYNDQYSSSTWFLYYSGTYWYTTGDWSQAAATAPNICPPNYTNNHTVVLLSADTDGATADNDVMWASYGGLWNTTDARFSFDDITDGTGDPFGGCPGGANCGSSAQPIPQVSITGITGTGPWTVSLTWDEPAYFSSGAAGHPEFFAGYRVYYLETNEVVPVGNPATPPTTNAIGSWTVVDGNAYRARGSAGATVNHDVTINTHSGTNYYMWFALSMNGEGFDNSAGATVPYGETAFVGQSSTNTLGEPGAIELLNFEVSCVNSKAAIVFETASEVNTLGFNILRSATPNGLTTKVNDSLIPAKGNAGMGAKYRFMDRKVKAGNVYYYTLQEVETTGTKVQYGSFAVTIKAPNLQVMPR